MKRLLAGVGAMALGIAAVPAGMAQAGALGAPVAEPVVAAPAPAPAPMTFARDWTGFYGGARIGWGDTGRDARGNGAIGGLHLGYLQDFGGFAAGIEAGYDAARINARIDTPTLSVPDGRINEVLRLGARAGVTTGDLFVYGIGGAARARVRDVGSDNGWYGGVGAEFALTDQWRLGAELLHHRFSDFAGSGASVSANTLQARMSFRF